MISAWSLFLNFLHLALAVLVLKSSRRESSASPFLIFLLAHLTWINVLTAWSSASFNLSAHLLITQSMLGMGLIFLGVSSDYLFRQYAYDERTTLRYWTFQANNLILLLLIPSNFIAEIFSEPEARIGIFNYYFALSILAFTSYVLSRLFISVRSTHDSYIKFSTASLLKFSLVGLFIGIFFTCAFPMPSLAMTGSVIVETCSTSLTIGVARLASHGEVLHLRYLLNEILKLPNYASNESKLRIYNSLLYLSRLNDRLTLPAQEVRVLSDNSGSLTLSQVKPSFESSVSEDVWSGIQDRDTLLVHENERLERSLSNLSQIIQTNSSRLCEAYSTLEHPLYLEGDDAELNQALILRSQTKRGLKNLLTFKANQSNQPLSEVIENLMSRSKEHPISLYIQDIDQLNGLDFVELERFIEIAKPPIFLYLSARPGSLEENMQISEELYCRLRSCLVQTSVRESMISPTNLERNALIRQLRKARYRFDSTAEALNLSHEELTNLLKCHDLKCKDDVWWELSRLG